MDRPTTSSGDQHPNPIPPPQQLQEGSRERCVELGLALYHATTEQDWKAVKSILDEEPDLLCFPITRNEDTILHLAVSAERNKSMDTFVSNLVELMKVEDLELQNRQGNTTFKLAVVKGNVEAARIMLTKNPRLLEISDKKGILPFHVAALCGNADMLRYLYHHIKTSSDILWSEVDQGRFLRSCVEADIFDIAIKLVNDRHELLVNKRIVTDVLLALAKKTPAFLINAPSIEQRIINLILAMFHVKAGPSAMNCKAMDLLTIIRDSIVHENETGFLLRGPLYEFRRDFSHVLFVAVKTGNSPFVIELARSYPNLIWERDDKGRTIFHLTVKYRQPKIYKLVYAIGGRAESLSLVEDFHGNNMLHMFGKRPKNKPYENMAGGRALEELQRDLFWFQSASRTIPPQFKDKENDVGLTPQVMFDKEHEGLLEGATSWMKKTSNDSIVVTTLIATIVFSAAMVVPGGNIEHTGLPFFRNKLSFIIFVMSDTVSLMSSSISILIFLSLITSNYSRDEFLVSLPLKLVMGFATLFISIVSLMVAFGAGFFAVCYEKQVWLPLVVTFVAISPFFLSIMVQFPRLKNFVTSAIQPSSLL